MSLKKILVALVATLTTGVSAQQPGAWSPDYNVAMPNYFSGTNCRAYGNLYIKPPPPGWPSAPQFIDAQLYVNGTLVDQWVRPPGDVPYQHVFLSAMFDSSHFANQSNIHIRVTGHDTVEDDDGENRFYDSDVDDPGNDAEAWNRAMLFEHPDPKISPNPIPLAQSLFQNTNYEIFADSGSPWTEAQYFAAMDGSNVVFYAGHGAPSVHESGNVEGIFWYEYEPHRMNHIGSGVPPYNSGSPSVNFLYLLACNCGQLNNFVRACWPYRMDWGGVWMENQCWLGYNVYTVIQEYHLHTPLIWVPLTWGNTALHARSVFNQFLTDYPGVINCWSWGVDTDTTKARPMVPGELILYANYSDDGDGGVMRIKSVYTGDNGPSPGWFRPL